MRGEEERVLVGGVGEEMGLPESGRVYEWSERIGGCRRRAGSGVDAAGGVVALED